MCFFNLQFTVLILCKNLKTTKYSVVIYIYKFNVLHYQKKLIIISVCTFCFGRDDFYIK